MKTQDELKRQVAEAALEYVRERLDERSVIGIGTGSTANEFIDALATIKATSSGISAESSQIYFSAILYILKS